MFKQTGRIIDGLGLLAMARDAQVLIGHTRWATQGDPDNNLNNHPHPCDGGWIVHNGMIPHYRELIAEHDLHPVTDCDSEVLALLVEKLRGDLLTRCVQTANIAGQRKLVMLGLWKPGRLVAVRHGNPLHLGETSRGYYLGSLASGLPGNVSELPDNQAWEFGEAA
jgi:glucosamine 6-phosphate synthetase-like amidotransferase/phosphosugar isomerase protein